jgi:hypothetical protein
MQDQESQLLEEYLKSQYKPDYTNHTKENHNSNISHSKENIKIMNKLPELNTLQYKNNIPIMNQYKELNKFQLPDNILTITPLNTKLNMFLKLTIQPKLNMYHNKNNRLKTFISLVFIKSKNLPSFKLDRFLKHCLNI